MKEEAEKLQFPVDFILFFAISTQPNNDVIKSPSGAASLPLADFVVASPQLMFKGKIVASRAHEGYDSPQRVLHHMIT